MLVPIPARIVRPQLLEAPPEAGSSPVGAQQPRRGQGAQVIELTAPTPQRLMADGVLVGYTPLRMDVLKGAFSLFTVADPPPL